MRKLFKFLILFVFALAGLAFLAGSAGSVSAVSSYAGADIVTIDVGKEASGVKLLGQDKRGLIVRMDIGSIEFIPIFTREGSFILPRIDGFSRSFKVGEPCLPVAAKLLTIPFGSKLKAKVIDFETVDIDLAAYNLTDPLLPVQPPLSKSEDPESVKFEYDRAVYSMPGKYSLPLAKADVLGTLRATRLGRISIAPIEYYPTENRITVYKSVTVGIKFKDPDWPLTRKMWSRYSSVFFEPIYRQILNYVADNGIKSDLVKYPVKYAVVSHRMFESQLQPFIQWKTKKGFTVVIGYTDVIGSTTSAIKSWLQDLYNAGTPEDPAPSFVLFVGDVQQIPAWSGSAGSHITDLKYCEFTGDNFPEIYYGRFSAQNTTQLQPQIDKTLEYEQYQMPDPGYLAEVTLVSGVDAGYAGTYGNGQINYGTNNYFNAAHGISPNVWLYPDSDLPSAPNDIIQTVNSGIGFYNYTAHCSHNGPSDPAFTQTDIANLTNIHKYLLGIGNCCLSNTFGSDYSTPCFGEAWLQAENKGGIGWIGGSNSTYWDEDYWWGVGNGPIVAAGPTYEQTGIGAYDGVFHDHGEPVTLHYTANGAIIFAGNMAVTEAGSSRIQYYWEIYHLMGDPALMTYLWVPSANTVSHPSSVTTTATSITVQADPGSYVGITRGGVLHGAGYIDNSGSANIPLTPFGSTGTADIVVTCQNKIPYENTIVVNEGTSPPVADFVGSPTSGVAPLTVNFTDQSTGATSWSWNFGDSTTSSQQNPTHQYTVAGIYTVSLTVSNAYGSDTETKVDYITVTSLQPPVADFTASATSIEAGQSVTFTDQSTGNPTSWSWTFEGGTPGTSTQQNPTVTYNTPGIYDVSLTVSNAAGSDTETKVDYITVTEPPISYCTSSGTNQNYEYIAGVQVGDLNNPSGPSGYTDFTYLTAHLTAGESVSVALTPGFVSSSYNEYWKIWIDYNHDGDFEDSGEEVFSGSGSSVVTGSFTVPTSLDVITRMRVSMSYSTWPPICGTFTYGEVEDYTVDISGGTPQPPVANFTASATTIYEGQNVAFTDQSTGNPTSWAWTFQGGTPSSSSSQNPTVTYNTAGTFDVSLTATNAVGSDTETKLDYITVQEQPPVEYCTSSGNSQSYEWIARVRVANIDKSSGASPYSDFTSIVGNLTKGSSASVYLTPGFSGSSYTEYWRIWIDYNQDGDFADSGEQVFSKSGSSTVSGSFTVPTSALSGNTRMRVSMRYGGSPPYCGTFTYGEVEDYTVNIN